MELIIDSFAVYMEFYDDLQFWVYDKIVEILQQHSIQYIENPMNDSLGFHITNDLLICNPIIRFNFMESLVSSLDKSAAIDEYAIIFSYEMEFPTCANIYRHSTN